MDSEGLLVSDALPSQAAHHQSFGGTEESGDLHLLTSRSCSASELGGGGGTSSVGDFEIAQVDVYDNLMCVRMRSEGSWLAQVHVYFSPHVSVLDLALAQGSRLACKSRKYFLQVRALPARFCASMYRFVEGFLCALYRDQ